jgi:hypothetical protein
MTETLPSCNNFLLMSIIIIRRELGLDRPVSASSKSPFTVFQAVFAHSVYNSTLFLAPCCFSFLSHVVQPALTNETVGTESQRYDCSIIRRGNTAEHAYQEF